MVSNGYTPRGKKRYICFGPGTRRSGVYCCTTTNPDGPAVNQAGKPVKPTPPKKFKRALGGITRFVITSAQNATPVNDKFLQSLQTYCDANDAELIVIPIRYRNPTSRWTASQQGAEWWAREVEPYLYNGRKKLCENLVLLGDIKTTPTAVSPLTGFETITHGESGILGHSKMQLVTVPTPSNSMAKIMATTGSLTLPNYTDSKAGAKGAFHHVTGALVVEVSGRKFHLRQINANKDGSFIDWGQEYFPDKVLPAPPAAALVMGDTHYRYIDPLVKEATFGNNGIIEQLRPEVLVWHDLLDGYSRNPHHAKNPFIEMSKRYNGNRLHDVRDEVYDTVQFLNEMTIKHGCSSIVVQSNHDDFLRRWIVDNDWRLDPENAEFYLETALAMARSVKTGPGGSEVQNPFTYWVNRIAGNDKIRCLHNDESFIVAGIECGMHGHRGPNGARGSRNNLSKIGVKSCIGHSHSPGIEGGCYQAGTSTKLRLEYTQGPSGWMNTHIIIYANGKRSLINVIDGEFKGG